MFIKTQSIIVFLFTCIILSSSCSHETFDLNPKSYLSNKDQLDFKMELSRYIHKLPPQTTMEMRWDSSRDDYYRRNAEIIDLVKLYRSEKDSMYYFYITRITPSIRQGERKAIAGKCNFSDKRISNIEEFFITSTESSGVLYENAEILLSDVIKINKAPEDNKLIEWPNDYFYYNKNTNQWDRVSSRVD